MFVWNLLDEIPVLHISGSNTLTSTTLKFLFSMRVWILRRRNGNNRRNFNDPMCRVSSSKSTSHQRTFDPWRHDCSEMVLDLPIRVFVELLTSIDQRLNARTVN